MTLYTKQSSSYKGKNKTGNLGISVENPTSNFFRYKLIAIIKTPPTSWLFPIQGKQSQTL